MPKASINLPDGTSVMIEGSLEEVAKLLAIYSGAPNASGVSSDGKYTNVIDYDGNTINILKLIGKNKAEKSRNLILVYVWAKKDKGVDAVDKTELISICKHHECYDEANFKHIVKNTSGLTIKGTSKKYSVRLTAPGIKKAKQLLTDLNKDVD